jgi:hypothetical protein
MDEALQRAADDIEIRRILARYCRGVDRLDRELIVSCYWPDAVDSHVSFVGPPGEFADWVIHGLTTNYLGTAHVLGQTLIQLDGESADVETYFTAHHLEDAAQGVTDAVYQGRYLDKFEKRRGVWKILTREVITDFRWTQAIDAKNPVTGAQLPTRRSAEDPSFKVPALSRKG